MFGCIDYGFIIMFWFGVGGRSGFPIWGILPILASKTGGIGTYTGTFKISIGGAIPFRWQ